MGLFSRQRRMDHDQWTAYLTTPGQQLTVDEFRALEAASAHALLQEVAKALGVFEPDPKAQGGFPRRIAIALGVIPGETGGYVEQGRNLLDRLAGQLTVSRPGRAGGRPSIQDLVNRATVRGADRGLRVIGDAQQPELGQPTSEGR